MPLSHPDIEYTLDGLTHRRWVWPARRYADGGFRSERWVYAVGMPPYVCTFTVITNRYPEGWNAGHKPYGAEESCHRADEDGGTYPCIYLDGLNCRGDGSGMDAHDWYVAQPKNAEGFVADDAVFAHLRDLYTEWNKP